MEPLEFTGKVGIVTGASKGIGNTIARMLAARHEVGFGRTVTRFAEGTEKRIA